MFEIFKKIRPAVITSLAIGSGLGVGIAFGASIVALSPAMAGAIGVAITSVACTSTSACVSGTNASSGPGASGSSVSGYGLVGKSASGIALFASSSNNIAVSASNNSNAPTIYGKQSGVGPAVLGSAIRTGVGRAGIGVEGQSPNGRGVLGTTDGSVGVEGVAQSGYAVLGQATTGIGVHATATTGTAISGTAPNGFGLTASGLSGITGLGSDPYGFGVYGKGGQGGYFYGTTGEGVYAASADYTNAIHGVDNSATTNGPTDTIGVAIYGESQHGVGGYFRASDVYPALVAMSGSAWTGADVFDVGNSQSDIMNLDDNGVLTVYNDVVQLLCPAQLCSDTRVKSYTPHESVPTLEDVGKARLVAGSAYVALDPAFVRVMNATVDYSVLVTPEGDSNGIFVAQHSARGFLLRENRGGRSTLTVSYRIVATPAGKAKPRLPMVSTRLSERLQAMVDRRPHAAPRFPAVPHVPHG